MPDIGPKISGFIPISLLGKGGFADVYLYQQSNPDRKVAIKILRDLASREGKQAFLTESEVLAKTSTHPAIVSLYDSGKLRDQRPFLVMQYCPVANLSSQIRKTPFSLERALDTMVRLCGATEMVHRAGMVHRDIKPGNVLISEYGTPVLSDFGLALPIDKPVRHRDIVGLSVPWAPPEQHERNSSAHPSADVYSLAATMHSFLTGRSPFELVTGENTLETISQRVCQAPLQINDPRIPAPLAEVFYWALDKDPAARPSSAQELGEVLQSLQRSLQLPVTSMDVDQVGSYLVAPSTRLGIDETRMAGQNLMPGEINRTGGGRSAPGQMRPGQAIGKADPEHSAGWLAGQSAAMGELDSRAVNSWPGHSLSLARSRTTDVDRWQHTKTDWGEPGRGKPSRHLLSTLGLVLLAVIMAGIVAATVFYYLVTSQEYVDGISDSGNSPSITGPPSSATTGTENNK